MERGAPVPHRVRGAVVALAAAALAAAILWAGGSDAAVSTADHSTDDVCVAVDDTVGGTVLRCTHADEPPPGVKARERSARELVAEAGGAGVVARFASTEPGAVIDVDRTKLGGTAGPVADGFVGGGGVALGVESTVPSTGTPGIACWGAGSTGNRVQAVYAYTGTDRSATYVPLIRKWAAEADITVRVSAQQSGGRRHINWVHTSSCVLSVVKVKLSSAAASSFNRTISELAAKGLKRTSRRYLVWMDANRYCGIGTLYSDDRNSKANRNNGYPYGPTAYSRIDRQCWGLMAAQYHSVEAHELMHNLGAVQYSAPHSTRAGHCYDEYDVMCYDDGGSRSTMKAVCKPQSTWDLWLDCRHDDYFNLRPGAGTYLYSHWNVAKSSFLNASTSSDPILTAFSAAALPGPLSDPTGQVTLAWSIVADASIAKSVLERSVDGAAYAPWATVTGTALTTTQTVDRGHSYTFRITVYDGVGRRSFARVSKSVTLERDVPPTVTDPSTTIRYNSDTVSTVLVTWTASDDKGVVSSELERSTDATTWTPAWAGTERAAEVTVPSGATYTFRVRARDTAGQWSAWGVSAPLVVPIGAVDAPPTITSTPLAQVSSSSGTTSSISVTWDATDDHGIVSARVEVAQDGGPYTIVTAGVESTYAELTVAQGHTYTFRVAVFDQIQQASAPATSAPLVVPVDLPPAITSGPTATITSSTWNAQNPPSIDVAFAVTDETAVEHVELWRGSSATGPWTVVTAWGDPAWSPITGQVAPGATYWFRLVAVDVGGHSVAKVTPSGLAIAAQQLPAIIGTPTAAISQGWPWAAGEAVEVTVSYASLRTSDTEISMSSDGGATWEIVAGGDASSATAYALAGGSYSFRVVAHSPEGLSSAPASTAGALVVPDNGP